jgi:hypothetical protein
MARLCGCGCGEEITGANSWKFKRGHKPQSGSKRLPPPSTALAKRERQSVIDAPADEDQDQVVYVDCQISVPQLDKIYSLLAPTAKAIAVLTGVDNLD